MALKRKENKENVPPERRFKFTFDEDHFGELAKGYQPPNTVSDTNWAMKVFEEWRASRNAVSDFQDDVCPENIFTLKNKDTIAKWLGLFAIEARRQDGKKYPPRTIHHLLLGLQRHMRLVSPNSTINLFGDPEFLKLQNVCDCLFRDLHSSGIGTETKQTPVLDQMDEDKLWETRVINLDTPQGLCNAVFFYNGKNFCLRGGQEHRDLKFSQIKRKTVNVNCTVKVCYEYTEHGSKNRSGGIKQLRLENKVVVQYEDPCAGERCHVDILDKYFMKVPKEAMAKEGSVFYLRPLHCAPSDPTEAWFGKQPVGRNKLASMMKTMSAQAALPNVYTNHSLRAFGATKMFQNGVSEKIIQERTGHRSSEALRKYERVSEEQKEKTSQIMNARKSAHQENQMTRCPPQVSYPYSSQQQPSFSGCTFSGCSFTVNITQPPKPCDELRDISLEDIFADF